MVSDASRMFSAISFGVFCRAAPSTRSIIRSMKVSPGFVVILMTMRSESTFVPPVTADRSPPDSRMTGADSPVMADSSTEATPSTTSPSPGMTSPASQTTRSPTRSSVPGTCSSPGRPSSRRATVSVLALRRVSACALPRPSATASARLAKIDGQPQPDGDRPAEPVARVQGGQHGGEHRADLDHEHDRGLDHHPRVELAERRPAAR